ncbi:sodium:alanine symporter family protein [Planomicrobium sp. CPCC 101079]|uniref:alanine/glycine:cation symporter family protein n=1 Tax=Planomicrobium sp. CPCC 101079 TaxID=2599618 RepID=UPI0011B5298F|nr:alanine/glycine:cation symporter family protein [Planomicrobium sp. CPCC 101079]TWT01528.1 alanine:cation symporter family protein [Planomicrobium sp. CPCC 101079]
MENFVDWLNGIVWSSALVYLFLGVGLFYSIATRFLQVRLLKDMLKLTFNRDRSKAGVSSFQAFSMSLGSRVGTGNIAGVATAIAFGGPGAVFWMWVMALLGGATSFIEITMTQVYKRKLDGQYRGGVPYYIEKGLKIKWYAVVFALITLIVMGVLWPGLQANTIAISMENAFGIEPLITGGMLVVILGIIIFGGVKRIAKAAEIVVPVMAIIYIVMCLIILLINITELPSVVSLIFSSAFGTNAAFGGLVGSAIALGVQRGAFSNAAGIGSETYDAGAAEVSHPAKQGLVQAFSVYIDTLLICSATAFMILFTGMYNVMPAGGEAIVNNVPGSSPSAYTQMAIGSVMPGFGAAFLAIALFFFCFTTVMSYYYKAETCLVFLNRNRAVKLKWPTHVLKIVLLGMIFYGSVVSAEFAWALGDLGMGSMAWLNFVAILFLTKPALKVLRDYEKQKNEGKDPVFDAEKLGFEDAEFWIGQYEEPMGDELDIKKAEVF